MTLLVNCHFQANSSFLIHLLKETIVTYKTNKALRKAIEDRVMKTFYKAPFLSFPIIIR